MKKIALLLLVPCLGPVRADVKLPAIFSDHMVLQKTAKVPVWGRADPGEEITLTLDKQTAKTKASDDGKWSLVLNLEKSGPGPFEMAVEGRNRLLIKDVVVGEVWLASGQSNMQFPLSSSIDSEKEIPASANPMLRQFLVAKKISSDPLDDGQGTWTVASPETSGAFTAVGYYFGKKLNAELKIPVGLINASWGGTPSESWTSTQGIDTVPDLKATKDKLMRIVTDYPLKKQAFLDWLKASGREDKPVAEAAAFAARGLPSEGWVAVTLPGTVAAAGLPDSGAVWLRKEITIPADAAGKKLALNLSAPDVFDSVYWNGKLIHQTTPEKYPGPGYVRKGNYYVIPENLVIEGKNSLALRLYQPTSPAIFSTPLFAGTISLDGEWLAKAEYVFRPLDAEAMAAAPRFPEPPSRVQETATQIFNGTINPLIPYAIRGAIWYQGEANARRAWQYRTAFPLLITDWRTLWKQGDFPFYFCQLASYQKKSAAPEDNAWAELREAQTATLKLPHTGQAVLIDIGESEDIHPRNKKDAGERLARIALAKDYGKNIPFSGPVYTPAEVEEGKIRIKFTHTDGGLVAKPLPLTYDRKSAGSQTAPLVRNSPQSELEGFAICGEDKNWFWANAKIEGDSVLVWSDQVPKPVAVRYAWAGNPTCNLYNGAGFPASPFRTDDFPATTLEIKY